LIAVSRGQGQAFLSWSMLKGDTSSTRFNIYRVSRGNHAGFLVNEQPVSSSATFLDTDLTIGQRYSYYVRPVNSQGEEGQRSERVGVTISEEPSSAVTTFKPVYKKGDLVPVFGDLDGDGALDCVIRLDNGNREMSQDAGIPVTLEAFASYGRPLWRQDVCCHDRCYGSANNVPFNVWDMDGDGKAEVITRLQMGDQVYVAILDGLTGRLKHRAPWPEMVSDRVLSSTRIQLSIAYLDGVHPAVVTQTGVYANEVVKAFDAELNDLWQFNSFGETSGSGGHRIEVADIDGDGKQEVFGGTTCLRPDGTVRWSIYRMHPDLISIRDFLPNRPGFEVFYIIETSVHAGAYMVDARSGEIIWKVNREDDPRWTHSHSGTTADIWAGSPGIECLCNRSRSGHLVLFSADGRILLEPFFALQTVEWDGDVTRELLTDQGRLLGNFDGKGIVEVPDVHPNSIPDSQLLMTADLYGDFRDELVLSVQTEDNGRAVTVVTSTAPISQRYLSACEVLDYRLWLGRNMGGGYKTTYCQELMPLTSQ
jgi:rhamnogalacturonan endolyase